MNNILEYIVRIRDQFTPGLLSITRNSQKAFDGINSSANSAARGGVHNLYYSVLRLVTATAVVHKLNDALHEAAKMQSTVKAINFATGDKSGAQLNFIKNTADKYGLDLESSLKGYKTIAGSMKDSGLAEIQKTFVGVSESITAMGLSAADSEGVLLAIGQMASKGNVAAEELRGQVGERLTGAFKLAAQAMGVTEGALNKMLQKGEIAAKDFLPAFATQLHKTFGTEALDAANGPVANFNRMNNALYELKVTIGEKLLPAVMPFITNFLIPAVQWVSNNIDTIMILVTVVGSIIAAIKIWTAVQWVLNAALWANPIGVIILAVVALIALIIHIIAYKEAWGRKMKALWEIIKSTGRSMVLVFKDIWEGIKYYFELGILKVLEFSDIAGQKIANVAKSIGMLFTGDFQGAAEAWNAEEQSVYTKAITGLEKKHQESNKKSTMDLLKEVSIQQKNMKELVSPFSKAKNKSGSSVAESFVYSGSGSNGAVSKSGSGKSAAHKAADAITGGGAKNVYISLGKFMDNLNINTTTLKEGADEMERVLEGYLLRVLNSASSIN